MAYLNCLARLIRPVGVAVLMSTLVTYAPSHAADTTLLGAQVKLLLTHLPLKTSRAYHALRRAAGNVRGEILPMTKSEVWSVPAGNIAGVEALAQQNGVGVRKIDDDGMHALAPMTSPMTQSQSDMMREARNEKSTMGVAMLSLIEPGMLEYALTRSAEGPGASPPSITLRLSETITVMVRRTNLVADGDRYIWQGEIEGTGEPVTLVCWPMGRLAGTIHHAGHVYTVKNMGGSVHGVIETMPSMLPREHAPMDDGMLKKMNMSTDPLLMRGDASALMDSMRKEGEAIENLRDLQPLSPARVQPPPMTVGAVATPPPEALEDRVTITVIVAYTKAAARHYTDISKDLITLAIAEANQSFRASGIGNVELKLAHTYRTEYVEQGTHFDHMFRFAEKGDGHADEIFRLRDRYKADVAIMIVDDANGCGLSAGVAPPADRAFAVVHHGCVATTYSLAHEIGHIIGARHDAGFDPSGAPYPFGHGFVNGRKWRTMMSYEQSCDGCPRVPIWSNPKVSFMGEVAGEEGADNARVIREGAKRVAAFR